jgi:hypothetical protein
LPVALPRPLPAAHQHCDFFLAADKRRQMALPGAASAAACPNDPIQRHRLRPALELMGAAFLGNEQAGDLPLYPRCDDDRTRLSQRSLRTKMPMSSSSTTTMRMNSIMTRPPYWRVAATVSAVCPCARADRLLDRSLTTSDTKTLPLNQAPAVRSSSN